ncbi:MAG: UPF0280 family protein [Candidatus Omnitrophica bacterium]|nr:UPF0280 family protein [Candidatus Omnitrophota bacterium]
MVFKPRNYRQWVKNDDLVYFEASEKETDLGISADKNLERQAREAILNYRSDIERYIKRDPVFFSSLEPVEVMEDAPEIVRVMAEASEKAVVGPMASVAGAMAEFVGRELLAFSGQVIVENGGDIFLCTSKPRTLGIFAGEESPFTGKLAIEIPPSEEGLGLCTSSGTVSHSLSFGRSDAVLVMAQSAALADAMATSVGNILKTPEYIQMALDRAKSVDGVLGVVAIIGDKFGTWGNVKLI